jgi:hypothetical protein
LWRGFYDTNDIMGWPVSSTDSVSLGRLVIGTTTGGFQYTFPPMQFTNAYVVAGVRAVAVGAPSPAIEIQTGNNTVNQAYACYVATTATTDVYAYDFWPSQMAQAASKPWTGTFAASSDFVVTDKIAANVHTCSFTQGATTAAPTQSAGPHAGYVLLGAQNATAAYDYVFVVEMP